MRIVVLDAYTLNPGDLSWADLEQLGPCSIYERGSKAQIVERAGEAEILLVNKVEVRGAEMERLPKLKYIGILATGTNVVDLQAARQRGIVVSNVPAYSTKSVAQTAFALLLELCQHVGHHAGTVRAGKWSGSSDWCYWETPLIELDGLTLGIIGYGRIGAAVAELGRAFGMKIVAYSPRKRAEAGQVEFLEIEQVFRRSDVLSLHCPLTPETTQLVNAERLGWMKPTAFLLNTSRGLLLDELAVAGALNAGRLAGAGLDVLSLEPPPAGNPLLTAKNCIITPHLAWATRAARSRLMGVAVENVRAFLSGKPQNVVN